MVFADGTACAARQLASGSSLQLGQFELSHSLLKPEMPGQQAARAGAFQFAANDMQR